MPPKHREGVSQGQKSKTRHMKKSHSPRRDIEQHHQRQHQRRSSSSVSSSRSSSEIEEKDTPFLLEFPIRSSSSSSTAAATNTQCDFTNKDKKHIAFTRPLRRSTSPSDNNDHTNNKKVTSSKIVSSSGSDNKDNKIKHVSEEQDRPTDSKLIHKEANVIHRYNPEVINKNNHYHQTHLYRSSSSSTSRKPCLTSMEYVAPHRTRSPTRPPQRKQNERKRKWCTKRKWAWLLAPPLLLLLFLLLPMFSPEIINAAQELWCHPFGYVNITKPMQHLFSTNFSSWFPKWNLMQCSNRPIHVRHPCHCALKSRSKSLFQHFTSAISSNNNNTNTNTSSGEQSNTYNNTNVNNYTLNDRFTSILAGPVGGIRGVHIYQTFPPLITLERLQQLAQRENIGNSNNNKENRQDANLSNFDHESEFDAKSSVPKRRIMSGNASAMVKKLTNKLKNSNNSDKDTENVSGELNAEFLSKYSCLQVEEILDVFTSVEDFYNRLRCSFHIHNDNHTESETSTYNNKNKNKMNNQKSSLLSTAKSASLHLLPSSSSSSSSLLSWSSLQNYFTNMATRIHSWYNDHSIAKGKHNYVPAPVPGRCVVWLVQVDSVKGVANALKELLEDNTLRGNRVVPANSRGVLVLVSSLDRSELRSQLPDRVIHMFTTIS